MFLRGLAWAAALVCAGCSFDASGALFGAVADGGTNSDGRPAVADARPGTADAPASRPDAAGDDPQGTVRSPRGTVDLFDNDFEDWDGAPVYTFNIAEGMDYHPIPGYTPSASITFASMHDDDFVYFALIVEDDAVLPAAHPLWRDDSIAIYIDALGDASGPFGNDDHEIIIGSGGTYLDYAPGSINAQVSGDSFNTVDGYALEIGIDKSSLGAPTLPGVLGFDIAINDDDTYGDAASGLWFLSTRPMCPSCCDGFDHAEPWCDTTVLGSLILE